MKTYLAVLSEIRDIREITYSPDLSTYINEKSLMANSFKEMNNNKKYGGLEW